MKGKAMLKKQYMTVATVMIISACSGRGLTDKSSMAPQQLGEITGRGNHGAYAAIDESIDFNTLYLPYTNNDGTEKWPVVLWGNGGCRDNGLKYSHFLREIASHGYFVVASGRPRYERRFGKLTESEYKASYERESDIPQTSLDTLTAAIDWMAEENNTPGSFYYQKLDLDNIAVMGASCGGLQAIAVLTNPKVSTGIIYNSGVLSAPPPAYINNNVSLYVNKSQLAMLNGPVAYINGGEADIAYPNALDDLKRISHVPVFFAENGVGHGGTYRDDAYGGEYAQIAVHWLNWQFKGDDSAAKWFVGDDCVLCTDENWRVIQKNIN